MKNGKLLWVFLLAISSCAGKEKPMENVQVVVPHVDLEKYVGDWYEIARYPNRFQKGCTETSVTYSLRKDGKVDVVNRCRTGGPQGKEKSVEGRAWVVDRETNAKLKVQFFWPFSGAYWIIQLADDYSYAVVGHPARKYCWILSRTPEMSPSTYGRICDRLRLHGYDPARLIRAGQG